MKTMLNVKIFRIVFLGGLGMPDCNSGENVTFL
jgi:hypothetical protein